MIGHLCCLPIQSEFILALRTSTLKMEVALDHSDPISLLSLVTKRKCTNKHWYNIQHSIAWHIYYKRYYLLWGWDSAVSIATCYGLEGLEIKFQGGREFFFTCPDWPWGPPTLLYNGYRVFPAGKVAGAWC